MSLLDWIQRYKDSTALSPEDFKMAEALGIAVEALKEITDERCDKYHGDQAADALCRIEALGR